MLYAGTSFSLTCLISPNMTGVDTEVIVQSNITGPTTPDSPRVNTSQPVLVEGGDYKAVATFSYLLESDAGSYNCSAELRSAAQDSFVTTSDAAISDPQDIDVGRELLAL